MDKKNISEKSRPFSHSDLHCFGTDSSCCTSSTPCGSNDGDCDWDEDCLPLHECGYNNCRDVNEGSEGFDWDDDCCVLSEITSFNAIV